MGPWVIVYTPPNRFETVKKVLEAQKLKIFEAEVSMRPRHRALKANRPRRSSAWSKALEDLDDVQKVHANFDVPEHVLRPP